MHQTQCQALGYRIKIHRSYPQRNQREEQKKKHYLEYRERSHNRDTVRAQRKVTYIRPGQRQEAAKPRAKLLSEGERPGISIKKGVDLPSKDSKWPGMAPKESKVSTSVPGHPRGLYRGTLRVDWPVSLENGFLPVSPPDTIHFLHVF